MPQSLSAVAQPATQTFAFAAVSVVTTTVPTSGDAERLANGAVQERLAACVQVESMTSHYLWEGALQATAEWRLVFKTVPDGVQPLVEWLRSQHPYQLPQILMRGEQAQRDYAHWVAEHVQTKRTAKKSR